MTGGSNTGKMKNKKYHYYFCGNRNCPSHRAVPKDKVENDFTAFLTKNKPAEDFFEDLREAVKANYDSEMAFVLRQNEAAEKKIERLTAEKKNIMELMIREPHMVDDLKTELSKRNDEIRQLEISLQGSKEDFDIEHTLEFTIGVIQTLHEDWKKLGAKDLGVLKKILFPKNVEYHYPDIQTPELSIVYLLNQQFLLNKTHKGCLTGIGPVLPLPQSGALPLSYRHHHRIAARGGRRIRIINVHGFGCFFNTLGV